ncbi:hypothetical protein Pla123a_00100 [Posidoniimonas polymericola]|uniref:Segregation and condensation protein B n=1 Tax=Posidoniimonas polymericola TaxID=2528002 RepID=A0A5C5ZCZ7_9BACT|nr:SMC-Scp complex subunit ScpB [Posidoniimonas polymericola]TWT85204.1 hypothetical protein Pla123a_00100 [Posidoniimonas polymericola]
MTTLARRLTSPALRWNSPLVLRGGGAVRRPSTAVSAAPSPAPRPRTTVARRTRLEAILLLADEPLPLRRLAKMANLEDATEARTLLDELRRLYDARGAAFQITQIAGGHQLLTRPILAPWLQPLAADKAELRLTQPAMETLAVAAYRQPVLRAQIEAIRGVQCGDLLRQLMERDLLRIVGRSQELGRPILYGTTKRFLRVFGLKSLDDLPRVAGLSTADLAEDAEADTDSATIPLATS